MRVATALLALVAVVAAQCPTSPIALTACTNITCKTALPGTNPVSCQPAIDGVPDRVVVNQNGYQNFIGGCAVQASNTNTCTITYTGIKALAQQAADACPTTSGYSLATCTVDGVPVVINVRESSG